MRVVVDWFGYVSSVSMSVYLLSPGCRFAVVTAKIEANRKCVITSILVYFLLKCTSKKVKYDRLSLLAYLVAYSMQSPEDQLS